MTRLSIELLLENYYARTVIHGTVGFIHVPSIQLGASSNWLSFSTVVSVSKYLPSYPGFMHDCLTLAVPSAFLRLTPPTRFLSPLYHLSGGVDFLNEFLRFKANEPAYLK